jgi:ATP-dependent DNA helicase RecQ
VRGEVGAPTADAIESEADATAREVLGYPLRPSQRSAIAAVASGRDTLAVLPTGSGKSAIYQVAGLLRGGLTVVVSPLIALQRDQARSLSARRRPDGRALAVVALNSTLSAHERAAALDQLRRGDIDFLLLGPEQLTNAGTHDALLASPRAIELVAVDEAHLVSEWGHDFRPDYLRIPDTVRAAGRPPIVALTATAALPVQADITRQLDMTSPAVIVADFDRPNIRLSVRTTRIHLPEEQAVVDRTVEAVIENDAPAIVYATSHARCEDIAARLQLDAYHAAAYHAGLPAKRRAEIQDAFFRGKLDIIAATSAFGMGIDKANVRTVVHAGPPASLDEYYQEIGRAGRDGLPAVAELVFDSRSLRIPRLFASRPKVALTAVRTLLGALQRLADKDSVTIAELVTASGEPHGVIDRIIDDMQELGLIVVDDGRVVVRPAGLASDAASAVVHEGQRRAAVLNSQVDIVRHYAETLQCRRAELLAYFGEAYEPPCDNCDNDAAMNGRRRHAPRPTAQPNMPGPPPSETQAPIETQPPSKTPQRPSEAPAPPSGEPPPPAASTATPDRTPPSAVGSDHPRHLPAPGTVVQHKLWGLGTVMSADDHEIVAAFDSVGYRHLTTAVLDNGLLSIA